MDIINLIHKKKQEIELSKEEITYIVQDYVNGTIPNYQMSALLMAICWKGLTLNELNYMIDEMINSGEVLDLSEIPGIKVDKHSTGGIGDKMSLILAPILAALGISVAKMSGRGLGFTGGTIDKLESIPGYRVNYSTEEFIKQVKDINIAIIGQSKNLVLADKMIYALRDVTATVDSIPLIASSIMSKKIATGADAILLDVKCGDGAFIKELDKAVELSQLMIDIGKKFKRDIRIEITNMDDPLGQHIGNKNEVLEAIETLKGNGPKDIVELAYSSLGTMIMMAGRAKTESDTKAMIDNVIKNGDALNTFKTWINAQGGDVDTLFSDDFWKPKYSHKIIATKKGYMQVLSAVTLGKVAMNLGAGRKTKEDQIDFDAGLFLNKQSGDLVEVGDVIIELYSSSAIPLEQIEYCLTGYEIALKPKNKKIILKRM